MLAACIWSIYALDLATPGLRDRAGHIKGADFLHFYTAGYLVRVGRLDAVYDPATLSAYQLRLVPESVHNLFVASYGPQVYLPFSVLAGLPYGWAALAWALLNCALYFACCYALWRACPKLLPYPRTVLLLAAAFPGFFCLIAFGQTSGPALALFTLAFLALRAKRNLLAGLALGSLVYKPQLGLAAAVVFLLAAEWSVLAGAVTAAVAQISFAWAWFGGAVMKQYFSSLLRTSQALPFIEPRLYQLHSLRGFWLLLLPWKTVATLLYTLSAMVVLGLAVLCWRRRAASLALRYAALLIATVLAAPHLMAYDLVILTPAFLLLGDWALEHGEATAAPMRVFLYVCYGLPLFEPVAKIAHLQFSVIGFAALFLFVCVAMRKQASIASARQAAGV
ncbi:MAG TPA: glycosyltransferase family 87 protein [Terriglobales bacterium]|nr:glycosyltransferase family 87 protein [Terriglobales bacterium]